MRLKDVRAQSAEGRFVMKASTKRVARGMFHEVSGKAKGMIGSLISNRMLSIKGKMELISGKMQRKVGKVQSVCGF